MAVSPAFVTDGTLFGWGFLRVQLFGYGWDETKTSFYTYRSLDSGRSWHCLDEALLWPRFSLPLVSWTTAQ